MSRISFKAQHFSIGCLIVIMLLIATQASARGPGSPPIQTVSADGSTDQYSLHLEAVFTGNALIGQVTVSDKDGRPWTDVGGQAYLLDSSGQRVAIVPLQPLSPGEFRLIAPLSRLSTTGYLEIQLPGQAKAGGRRGAFQVDRANRSVTWVDNGPVPDGLSHRASGGPDAFGYTWDDTVAYGWVDTSGGVSVPLRDDDWVGPFNIGFTFNFYGESHNQFYLDSNGYIGFDSTQTESHYSNSRLPFPRRPNNLIAPFWDDFDPSQGGTVRYRTLGTLPNRYLVVEWNSVPLWGTSDRQSFQVILYETSNNIKFQYPATRQGSGGDLRYATSGIENADGTIGLEYLSIVPIDVTLAVQFNFSRPAYNVFLTPDRQGSSAAAGSPATFHVSVRNLGTQADSYTMSRSAFTGSDWAVHFYKSDGITPLPGNSTGSIAAGSQKDIVAKVDIPAWATVGGWSRATVRATSQGNGSVQNTAVIDAMLTPSFYQAYTDDDSGDGTEDSENYVEAIVDGAVYTRRLTTDQDNSSYSSIAAAPDGNAITLWNTSYWNNNSVWVSDIQYAVVNRFGNLVRSVTRLTDNSAATQTVYDFSPAVAVAPNGNTVIGWARQPGTYNVWYSIVGSKGTSVIAPAAFTFNTSSYPRDYPPSVAALTGGNFLLTWEHAATSSGPVDIYYAVLDNSGNIVRSATQLTDGTGRNVTPRVTSLPNDKTAIVWTFYNSDWNGEIYYCVLNADGTTATALTPVTSNGSSASSEHADAAALSDGQLAIAWTQFTASDSQIQYTIVSNWTTIVSEDFEGSFPGAWQVLDNDGTTNGEYYWAKRSCRSYTGGYSGWAVGGGADGSVLSCGSNYADNSDSWMVYGPFSLTDATAADLKFGLWLNSEPGWDRFWSTASINGYEFYGTPVSGTVGGGWANQVLDLRSVAGLGNLMGQANVWIALIFESDGSITYPEGAYVDNIILRKCASASCPAASTAAPMVPSDQVTTFAIKKARMPISAFTGAGIQQLTTQVIHTVPNAVTDANDYVSLAVDDSNRLIMTWLDNYQALYLLYALASKSGSSLTPATILQRTRHSYLWSSWNGYGNAYMPPQAAPDPYMVYLPVMLKDYPPPPPVTNGTFETGSFYGWTVGGDSGLVPRVVTSQRHSGSYAAVLGQESAPCGSGQGGRVGRSWIYQNVTVPSSGSAQLTFYYRIMTYDKLNADKYDRFEVYVNGTLLGRLGNTDLTRYGCSKPINDLGWRTFTHDLSSYRGQTVRLQLVNITHPDDWFGTWTYVDDVSLQ